jgi:hypothetical protein
MLAHLVEIFIRDPLRVVPFTLRGIVNAIDTCLETFSSLYSVLRTQMPQDICPEDGLIYDIQQKADALSHAAQSAKVLNGKLSRGVEEMKSQGLAVEPRHAQAMENCLQDVKSCSDCYRKVISVSALLMVQVIAEISKVQLYSAALDSQALQECIDTVAKEYPDFGPEIFNGLTKKLNAVALTMGNFIALVNDIEKTIERKFTL